MQYTMQNGRKEAHPESERMIDKSLLEGMRDSDFLRELASTISGYRQESAARLYGIANKVDLVENQLHGSIEREYKRLGNFHYKAGRTVGFAYGTAFAAITYTVVMMLVRYFA